MACQAALLWRPEAGAAVAQRHEERPGECPHMQMLMRGCARPSVDVLRSRVAAGIQQLGYRHRISKRWRDDSAYLALAPGTVVNLERMLVQ